MAVKKVTFALPVELVRRLKKVSAEKRSTFVKEAVERELSRQAAVAMLKRIGGKAVWKVEHHVKPGSRESITALERLRKRRSWGKNLALEIKKHRVFIKRYSGKAKLKDFRLS